MLETNQSAVRMTTCVCLSKEAEVYEIHFEDFLKECKKQACWREILQLIKTKRDKFAMRIVQKNRVHKDVQEALSVEKRRKN